MTDAARAMFTKRSILVVSGQAWKVKLVLVSMCLVLLSLFSLQLVEERHARHLDAVSVAFLLFFATLTHCFLSVRCPRCRGRYFWHTAKSADAAMWVPQAMAVDTCPLCQYSVDAA